MVCLGHFVDHKRVVLPSGHFELSILNVEFGLRTWYAGRLVLDLAVGLKIRGTSNPLADFGRASNSIEITRFYVESTGPPAALTEVAKAATSGPALKYVTRLLTTGTLTKALTADEISRLLGRTLPRAERKVAVRARLVELLDEHDGKPRWWGKVATDRKLLELAGRDTYTREHIYELRRDAIRDGDYLPPAR